MAESAARRPRWKDALRALRYRNFRLFCWGQGISLIGTWMQMVATGWLVARLAPPEHSAGLLGLVGFINRIPSAIVTPFAGVWIDRWNKHRTVVWMQVLAMLQAFVLAGLAFSGRIQIWHVAVLSAGLGLVGAIEIPARQSFFVDLIDDREDLGNAIALNSSLFNSARLIGPAVAGFLTILGEAWCFLINGLSYLAVIWGLAVMKLKPQERPKEHPPVLHSLKEGIAYAFGFEPIAAILIMVGLVGLMGMPYTVLMPLYAKDVLHTGSQGFGLLTAAGGVGALAGALYLAQRSSVRGLGKIIPMATCVFAAGLLLLAEATTMPMALALMAVIGAGMMVQNASANTLLQTLVDDDKRGRVMSLYALSMMGTAPFGSALAGWLGGRIGIAHTFQFCGLASLLGAIVFVSRLPSIRRVVHPIYVEKGIIPEIATGVDTASRANAPFRD